MPFNQLTTYSFYGRPDGDFTIVQESKVAFNFVHFTHRLVGRYMLGGSPCGIYVFTGRQTAGWLTVRWPTMHEKGWKCGAR